MAKKTGAPVTVGQTESERSKSIARAARDAERAASDGPEGKRPAPDKGGRVVCWDPRALNGKGSYRYFPAVDAYAGLDTGALLRRAPAGNAPAAEPDEEPEGSRTAPPAHRPPGEKKPARGESETTGSDDNTGDGDAGEEESAPPAHRPPGEGEKTPAGGRKTPAKGGNKKS